MKKLFIVTGSLTLIVLVAIFFRDALLLDCERQVETALLKNGAEFYSK